MTPTTDSMMRSTTFASLCDYSWQDVRHLKTLGSDDAGDAPKPRGESERGSKDKVFWIELE